MFLGCVLPSLALFDDRGLLNDYLVALGFPLHSDYSRLHELDCDDDHTTASLEVAVGSDDQSADVSVTGSDGSSSEENILDIWGQLDYSDATNYSEYEDDDDEGTASFAVAGGSDVAAFSDSTLVANEDLCWTDIVSELGM